MDNKGPAIANKGPALDPKKGPATRPPLDDKGPAIARASWARKGAGRASTGGPIGGPGDGSKGNGKKRKRNPPGGSQIWNEWDPLV